MPDLDFQIESAEPVPFAAGPTLAFKLRVNQIQDQEPLTPIHSISLRCQVRIEPARRRYTPQEQALLVDLYGEPQRWGQTMRPMLWTHIIAAVPPFTRDILIDLPVPCTYDFNIATSKYFHALGGGEVPLCFLFSGTIFYADAEDGALQVEQISWEKEADFRLPVTAWKRMMDMYYPNSAWLCLRKDVFDRLYRYKSSRAIPTWEQVLESLLDAANEPEAQVSR